MHGRISSRVAVKQFKMTNGYLVRCFFHHLTIGHLFLIRAGLETSGQRDSVANRQLCGKARASSPCDARNIIALAICPVYRQQAVLLR